MEKKNFFGYDNMKWNKNLFIISIAQIIHKLDSSVWTRNNMP